jgi:hypothetical protein
VFVAGGGEAWVDQSLHAIGTRIALELDRHTATERAQFHLDANSREEEFAAGLKTTVCTISRDDGGTEAPIIDLYRLETATPLTQDYQNRSSLLKAALPLWILLTSAWPSTLPRAVAGIFRVLRRAVARAIGRQAGGGGGGATTLRDQLQLVFALSVSMVLTIYLGILVWAAVATADPGLVGGVSQRVPQTLVLVLTALGLWKSGWVQLITQIAVDQLCIILNLGDGYQRDLLRGRLAALIEHVCEKPEVDYTRIILVGYSFGTIRRDRLSVSVR